MEIFLSALGLVLILEGIPYFISPPRMKEFMQQIQEMDDGTLRKMGLLAMIIGLLIIYLIRK
jgi:uncharacterized protein YjeT (DUF2065 family)